VDDPVDVDVVLIVDVVDVVCITVVVLVVQLLHITGQALRTYDPRRTSLHNPK
jgi:hypothetical protein